MLQNLKKPARVFYSYSHKDEVLRDQLESHLSGLKRVGWINEWHDRKIPAGSDWAEEIDNNIHSSDIILLLISIDFVCSNYCWDKEMNLALDLHDKGLTVVIPVILRKCEIREAPFFKLQGLPKNFVPINDWKNKDQAWTEVTSGIIEIIQNSPKLWDKSEGDQNEVHKEGYSKLATMVDTGVAIVEVEITIKAKYDHNKDEKVNIALADILALLKPCYDVVVKRKRPGSIKFTIDLTADDAERVMLAIRHGALESEGIIEAQIVRNTNDKIVRDNKALKKEKTFVGLLGRFVDIAVSVVVLAVFLLLLPILTVVIKLDSNGPVFYTQQRLGINRRGNFFVEYHGQERRKLLYPGALFDIIKLRTMGVDSERNGPQLAQKVDIRITRIGHFLRKTRIDKMPTFFNVLKGEMSLVGPRPERPVFARFFETKIPGYEKRLTVKPGITGLAQIQNRSDGSIESEMKKFDLDRQYIEQRTPLMDFKIIVSTFKMLLGIPSLP